PTRPERDPARKSGQLYHAAHLCAPHRPEIPHVTPRQLLRLVVGSWRNPLDPNTRRRTRLVAALAWAGLGANGLSAACYGPEKAFLALGVHAELGPVLALIMMISVGVLALAYSQMFELFPNGGGSYRVASQLLGPSLGLVSGAALLIDY